MTDWGFLGRGLSWSREVSAGESLMVMLTLSGGVGRLRVYGVGDRPVIDRICGAGVTVIPCPPAVNSGVWDFTVTPYDGWDPYVQMDTDLESCRGGTAVVVKAVVSATPDGPFAGPALNDGLWRTDGGFLLDGLGRKRLLRGANIGVNVGIGGAIYPTDESVNAHTAEALEWGWNTVRFTVYCSDEISWIASYGVQKAIDRTFAAAQKYLDAGFVVILALMDITAGNQPSTPGKLTAIESFIRQAGARFAAEPRLWVNVNEPVGINTAADFQAFHGRMYSAFRENSNAVYVADVMTNAQDGTWGTSPKVHDPSVGPAFLVGRANVVFSLHNYGGQAQNTHSQDDFTAIYTRYLQKCAAAGLAMVIGETGYRVDGRDQAGNLGDVNRNVRGFRASLAATTALGLGALVWDGTFDLFGLKNTRNGTYHCQPFWFQGASGDLSLMGQEFWDWCHQ